MRDFTPTVEAFLVALLIIAMAGCAGAILGTIATLAERGVLR